MTISGSAPDDKPHRYCPFVVGDHVVCIDAVRTNDLNTPELVENRVYTVRWVGLVPTGDTGPYHSATIGIRLRETHRLGLANPDFPFAAERFRPAPSIASLAELLQNAPVPEAVE